MRTRRDFAIAALDRQAAAPVARLFGTAAADGGAAGWSEAGIRRAFDDGGYGFVARSARGDIVGAILFLSAGDDMEIANVAVAAAARRSGLGARLLDRGVAAAKARAAQRIVLEVAADNTVAATLYRGRGFRPVGRRPNYYKRPSGLIDAEVMALELS